MAYRNRSDGLSTIRLVPSSAPVRSDADDTITSLSITTEASPGRTILIAALINGGSIDDVEPGIKFLGRMRDQVAMFHSSDTTVRRARARGEFWAIMGSPSALKELADQNIAVAMVCPARRPPMSSTRRR